jgi:hypothetical protein
MRNIFGYFFTVIALIFLILYILGGSVLYNWDIPLVTSESSAAFFSYFGCNMERLQGIMIIFFVVFIVTGILGFGFFLGFKRKEKRPDDE